MSLVPCPDHVAIIGGGRWARVLTEALCGIVPPSVEISVHSEHNAAAMADWARSKGLADRLRISASWPSSSRSGTQAAIVVNAARDHERAAEWALAAGGPVLVEKPLASSGAGARRLAAMAGSHGTRLAAAHVLRFAAYLERFAALAAEAGSIGSIRIEWWDPRAEERYGEAKHFDARVPIVADVLPHILSIVSVLTASLPVRFDAVSVSRGGAQVELDGAAGPVPCHVQLVRNGERRRRFIEVASGGESPELIRLDFATEPGVITRCAESLVGDPDWATRPRPVAQMLAAFLRWAAGGDVDSRLDVEFGLQACAITDRAMEAYRDALAPWVSARLDAGSMPDEDLQYAVNENPEMEPALRGGRVRANSGEAGRESA